MKIGILGAADIAAKRFLPALKKSEGVTFAGVASRTKEKSEKLCREFGGRAYENYEELLNDASIDAVYLPLPPALHSLWGERVLGSGKHLLMEKPFSASLSDTKRLIELAKEKNLAVHENYMFLYHAQLNHIKEIIKNGDLGDIRLIKAEFGFPHREISDFRYNKALGGGSLLDCGGYPVRLITELLGNDIDVKTASLSSPDGYEVDLYGSATLQSGSTIAQISFGMDQTYRCNLDIWGNKGSLSASRIFTAPPELLPPVSINGKAIDIPADDAFYNSIEHFIECISNCDARQKQYGGILTQAELIEKILTVNGGAL